jgi:hypothetical protein
MYIGFFKNIYPLMVAHCDLVACARERTRTPDIVVGSICLDLGCWNLDNKTNKELTGELWQWTENQNPEVCLRLENNA